MSHPLVRCSIVELGVSSVISYRDLDHMDELCAQLYFDSWGHGINWEFAARKRKGK